MIKVAIEDVKPEETQKKGNLRKVNKNYFGSGKKCKYVRDTLPGYKYIKTDEQKVK